MATRADPSCSLCQGPWPPSIAVQEFKKQFKAKAAVDWEKRVGMVQKKGM